MKKVFLLSGENLELAQAEILALTKRKPKNWELIDNVIISNANFKLARLALTKKVYEYLFQSTSKNINKKMEKYNWNKAYKKNFSLRISNVGHIKFYEKEAQLAKHIWNQIKEPRVDLKQAVTKFELVITEKKILGGKILHEPKNDYKLRRPHLRPAPCPTSLSPKLARACINLTGIQTGKTLCDPFCGSGGILLEAGLMRFKTIGYDVDKNLLKSAKKNLDYYKIKGYSLDERDSTKLCESVDYVVTDLPYGKSSKITDSLKRLYFDFLTSLSENLKYKAVVIFPDFIDHKKIIKKTSLVIEKEFSWYVHRSLTRNIVLLNTT
ncbi:methyltransferase domain-containing protein [Candidatus Woesearchaeota archaeon]|jgi:tRNA (guanine10-N2)-dimethyltransferase|nr:methyltransferase domain-containing protein [Candidatus Woesearchaeota archaeon]